MTHIFGRLVNKLLLLLLAYVIILLAYVIILLAYVIILLACYPENTRDKLLEEIPVFRIVHKM